MSHTVSYAQLEQKLTHAREALELITLHIATISVPNGTSKVIDRIAVAGLTGDCLKEAAATRKGKH